MENSPFGRLPGEIRNQIYELVLHTDEGIIIYYYGGFVSPPRLTPLALRLTCKAIRAECYGIALDINKVTIHNKLSRPHHTKVFDEFPRAVGRAQCQRVRDLVLDMDFKSDTDMLSRMPLWDTLRRFKRALHPNASFSLACSVRCRSTGSLWYDFETSLTLPLRDEETALQQVEECEFEMTRAVLPMSKYEIHRETAMLKEQLARGIRRMFGPVVRSVPDRAQL